MQYHCEYSRFTFYVRFNRKRDPCLSLEGMPSVHQTQVLPLSPFYGDPPRLADRTQPRVKDVGKVRVKCHLQSNTSWPVRVIDQTDVLVEAIGNVPVSDNADAGGRKTSHTP
ncbi:MAG: hypothetical protein V3T92_07025 [Anaerolineae bacterium]